jgi:hypothetical protein
LLVNLTSEGKAGMTKRLQVTEDLRALQEIFGRIRGDAGSVPYED